MKRILVPLTLLSSSHAAIPIALRLARESGATVVFMHVIQPTVIEEENEVSRGDLLARLRRDAKIQLNQLADTIRPQITTEIAVCEGHPAEMIVKQAGLLAAEMIVMCSHGYRGWLKWLHRNTALYVLKYAPCPVWSLSPGGSDRAVSLTLADNLSRLSEHPPWEQSHPVHSLFQLLFPDFGNAGHGGMARTFFTLNLTVNALK